MTDVLVPTVPPLVTIPNVELVQAGTWTVSNGTFTWATEDLYSAVAALACPAVRRPVLKLGHDGRHGIGEPAIGYIANMAVADDGRTLVGDYKGMPGWLGEILASAYPDRSAEWTWDFTCQMGHLHPSVLEAVSLLGVEAPGIGSIASLQDVAELYGVEGLQAAASTDAAQVGARVQLVISGRTAMPNPQPRQVAASVTSADVSRAFYASPVGADWDIWIEELQVDPLQVVYCNDADGFHYRIPVIIGDGDGTDAVSFGEPVRVVNNWIDAPANQAAATGADENVVRFASREESRPGPDPRTPQTPAATAAGTTDQEGSPAVAFSDEQLTTLRQRLGVADDADETTILAALDEALDEHADPPQQTTPTTPVIPEGMTLIETPVLESLQVAATAGQEARNEQLRQRREHLVDAAVSDGRIPPARREHWLTQLEADAGAEDTLDKLAKGLVPVIALGSAGDPDQSAEDADYRALFGDEKASV